MTEKFKFSRSGYKLPNVKLQHVVLFLSFREDSVSGDETLTLIPSEDLSELQLDASDIDIASASLAVDGAGEIPLSYVFEKRLSRLTVILPHTVKAGTPFKVRIKAECRPSDNILDGIYRDVTPAGAPPQYISQCQQWGFRRIMPIVDDCTAKCKWRTTLEGSSRYTHLISNGDVSKEENPDGKPVPVPGNPELMRITYVNNIPMPPYLFIAAAGTWDAVSRDIVTHTGRRIRLEYLVPPGCSAGAAIPMDILESSVLWQAKKLNYEYMRDCYRTICMEKSNFGGMENVGNTTIITEAALVDRWVTDSRLVYACGVIIHEYEHNHCGSDVTMLTPFDMWLNEAYTVNVERSYLADTFGREEMRLDEIDEMRDPMNGPLADEESGTGGQIVRDGFNNPDDVVDGTTYVKAPEVLGMLQELIGEEAYTRATNRYFEKFGGGNASTDDFLSVFFDCCPEKQHLLKQFFDEWLFSSGYPDTVCRWSWDEDRRSVKIEVKQVRRGGKGGPFVFPFTVTAVSREGRASASRSIVVKDESRSFSLDGLPEKPAFVDWNSGKPFYGRISEPEVSLTCLSDAVRLSPDDVGKAEAAIRFLETEMAGLIRNPEANPSEKWLETFAASLAGNSLRDGIKARLLSVRESMSDGKFLPLAPERRRAADRLRHAAAEYCGLNSLMEALSAVYPEDDEAEPVHALLPLLIPRRKLRNSLIRLIAACGTEESEAIVEKFFHDASNITDKLNAAYALCGIGSGRRLAVMRELREMCVSHISAYSAFLRIVSSSPAIHVFTDIAAEEASAQFSISHPAHSRSLYCGFAANNDALWTGRGLAFAEKTIIKLSEINENTALRVFSPLRFASSMSPEYRESVLTAVKDIQSGIDSDKCPSLYSEIQKSLSTKI